MKTSFKAALLSAFVFPGVGQLWLKKYVLGCMFSFGAAVPLYIIISTTVEQTQKIIEQINLQANTLDILVINELVTQQMAGIDTQQMHIATISLLAIWLVSILDAFRIGRHRV
ncbi:MAG: hypothetical protein ACI808_002477 [Paraglaciecola sp.]|jgi:hypothetical protein